MLIIDDILMIYKLLLRVLSNGRIFKLNKNKTPVQIAENSRIITNTTKLVSKVKGI